MNIRFLVFLTASLSSLGAMAQDSGSRGLTLESSIEDNKVTPYKFRVPLGIDTMPVLINPSESDTDSGGAVGGGSEVAEEDVEPDPDELGEPSVDLGFSYASVSFGSFNSRGSSPYFDSNTLETSARAWDGSLSSMTNEYSFVGGSDTHDSSVPMIGGLEYSTDKIVTGTVTITFDLMAINPQEAGGQGDLDFGSLNQGGSINVTQASFTGGAGDFGGGTGDFGGGTGDFGGGAGDFGGGTGDFGGGVGTFDPPVEDSDPILVEDYPVQFAIAYKESGVIKKNDNVAVTGSENGNWNTYTVSIAAENAESVMLMLYPDVESDMETGNWTSSTEYKVVVREVSCAQCVVVN